MSETGQLRPWLARREAAWARRPELEEALLGGRFLAYAWWRLRGFAAIRLLAAAVNVVELLLLLTFLPRGWLVAGVVAINACHLAAAFWWGALEILRARLRAEPSKAARATELGRWMARAAVVAGGCLVLLGLGLAVTGAPGAAAAYVTVCVLRLAGDLLLRTIYSAVYATRRIYRPMLSLVAAELVVLVLAGLTAQPLGAWSVPLAVAAGTVVSRALTLRYTLRAYRELRLPRRRAPLREIFQTRQPARVLLGGLANVATRLAPAAVLLLVSGGADEIALAVHAMAPLLVAAASWSQVFYLDVVRLSSEAAGVLRRRLERGLLLVAFPAGLVAWIAGVALASAVVPTGARLAAGLAPVFVAQAILGALQIASFARGRFAALAASGAALAVALAVLGPAGALVAAAVVLHLATLLARRPPPPRPDSLASWLVSTRAETITVATLAGATPRQARAFAAAVAVRLGDPGAAVAHGARVFWAGALGSAETAALSGGLVSRLERRPAAELRGAAPALPDARAAFRARFPTGLLVEVARGGDGDALDARARAAAWRQAEGEARGLRRRGLPTHDVTSLRERGEIVALFLVPRDVPASERTAWRHLLRGG